MILLDETSSSRNVFVTSDELLGLTGFESNFLWFPLSGGLRDFFCSPPPSESQDEMPLMSLSDSNEDDNRSVRERRLWASFCVLVCVCVCVCVLVCVGVWVCAPMIRVAQVICIISPSTWQSSRIRQTDKARERERERERESEWNQTKKETQKEEKTR